MPFIYVVGPAGSGKSALAMLLRARGFKAYDEDDPDVGSAHSLETGEPVTIPPLDKRDADWFSRHEWRVRESAKSRLTSLATTQPVILFGNSVKPSEQAALFDRVIYLNIDEDTLRERILKRADNDYGKSEDEMQRILEQKQASDNQYSISGALPIDATQPLEVVADAIERIVAS